MMFRPTLALSLLLAGGFAAAETSPYYIGVSQGFSHDSNIYRINDNTLLPSELSKSDTISATSLLAGLDQPIGRQRLFGNARLRSVRFKDNDTLNNEAYSADVGLDWSTINHLSGTLSAVAAQSLARYNPGNDVAKVLGKNTERSRQLDSLIRLGVVTRWTAEAKLSHREVSYSAEEFRPREYSQNVVSGGMRYSASGALNVGLALRRTEGKRPQYRALPDGTFQADRFERNDLDLTSNWLPSGASTINGRISISQVEHTEAIRRDFSGTTGQLRWLWKPTGKFALSTTVIRDTGEDVVLVDAEGTDTLASNDLSRTTTALRVKADYELSAKIALSAGAASARRKLVDAATFGNGDTLPRDSHDTTTSLNLGARWMPTRSLQLSCDMSRSRRSVSGVLSDPYSITSYGCTGQFVLQ
ncbi:MAG TPA: hypothetical protein VLK61_31390 [Aquabacterium sp.]|nr:hypothetical protein [Aquabacterium sp.]